MNYQEQYQKLIEELKKLKEKSEELQKIFITKKSEQSELNLMYRNLDDEIDDLLSKKETMHFTKKTNKLSTFFAVLSVSLPVLIAFISVIINVSYNIVGLAALANNLFIALPIAIISFLGTIHIGRAIIKKECNKVTNSNEYKELLKEIKVKEKQKEMLETNIQEISNEVESALSNFNTQKKLVDIKEKEILDFKEEVFCNVVNIQPQSEEKTNGYTRTRRK